MIDANSLTDAVGKVIHHAGLYEERDARGEGELRLRFQDGTGIALWDGGQSCCEERYLTCDDDLSTLTGAVLRRIYESDGPTDGDVHETRFVHIEIGYGRSIVLTCHNQHNGYYGGFDLRATALPPVPPFRVTPSALRTARPRKLQL